MKNILLLCSFVFVVGCSGSSDHRQYTEETNQSAEMTPQPSAQDNASKGNPHAGLDMSSNVSAQAHASLQKMLEQGQDPHAGLDMSSFGAKDSHSSMDPHAGMDMQGMMMQGAAAASPVSWKLPKGWKQGGKKGAMRLASFYLDGRPDVLDCSIVSLGGMAGGLEANLKRWMGQLAIKPSDNNLKQLLQHAVSLKTEGGLEAKIYDLGLLQKDPASKSMLAAMITSSESTVFVKMTADLKSTKEHREEFIELLKSLSPNQ